MVFFLRATTEQLNVFDNRAARRRQVLCARKRKSIDIDGFEIARSSARVGDED